MHYKTNNLQEQICYTSSGELQMGTPILVQKKI